MLLPFWALLSLELMPPLSYINLKYSAFRDVRCMNVTRSSPARGYSVMVPSLTTSSCHSRKVGGSTTAVKLFSLTIEWLDDLPVR